MGKKVEWRWRRKHTSDGTTALDIESKVVQIGWKRTIQRVAVEDETTAYTDVRIGYIDRGDRIGWYCEQDSPQAAVLYWMKDPVVLQEGDRLLVRLTGTTDEDVLGIYAYGYEEKVD